MKLNEIERLLQYIQILLKRPRQAKLDMADFSDDTLPLAEALDLLGECIKESQDFAIDLANGNIDKDFPVYQNVLAAPLKNIQSNLRHLAWIAERVSSGDYKQRVIYMGSLTEAFNQMIFQLRSQHEQMEKLINTDYLTGLGNRRAYNQKIEALIAQNIDFSIAFIDIDCLKKCNDHCGHFEGDQYICSISTMLNGICRNEEHVFRISGDEFVFISPHTEETELEMRLAKARQTYVDTQPKHKAYVRDFSYGCVYVQGNETGKASEILATADKKMYNSKMIHYLQREKNVDHIANVMPDELDKTGLEDRIFEVFSNSTARSYLYICNLQTNVSRWSAKAVDDFGIPGEYMYDAKNIWIDYIHPDDRQAYEEDLDAVFQGRKQFHQMEYRARMKDGNYVMCSCRGTILRGINGEPDLFAGTLTNHGIVDNIDSVTNLFNVYEFLNRLKRLKDYRKEAIILGIAISRFTTINDAYGYVLGNRILKQFAKTLQNNIRGKGQIFRLDGAKFACIFQDMDEAEIEEIYNAFVDIARNQIVVDDIHVVLPINGAFLKLKDKRENIDVVFAELMHAIALSKQENHGGLICYDTLTNQLLQRDRTLFRVIRKCIQNECKGFYLLYQPQFNEKCEMIGAEALLRWKSDEFGIVPPAVYISYMEEDSSFYDLGLWILRQGMRDAKALIERYPDFKLSINISYKQLEHYGFRDDLMKILSEEAYSANNLTLELTEHCQTLNPKMLKQDILYFQSKGIEIAADDFGTGYSSFSLMKQLPFDCIKIDQSFVLHLLEEKTDQIMVESIIHCAKALGFKICVEGVENNEILQYMKQYAIDIYQGYLFGRPIEIEKLLEI